MSKIIIIHHPVMPEIFSNLNFLDLRDEVITGLVNDDLNWTMYQQICNDCHNELMGCGTVVRICMDLRCNVFMLPEGEWIEVGSIKKKEVPRYKHDYNEPLRYPR